MSFNGFMHCHSWVVFPLILSLAPVAGGEGVALELTEERAHEITIEALGGGSYELRTTGGDPYVFTKGISEEADLTGRHVLAFEYFSATGTDHVQVFLAPPLRESHSIMAEGLHASEGWSGYAIDLKPVLEKLTGPVRLLRLDFGTRPNRGFQIRGLKLRAPNERELELAAAQEALLIRESKLDKELRDYLDRKFEGKITRVEANREHIQIEGSFPLEMRELFLVEVPIWREISGPVEEAFPWMIPLEAEARGIFSMTVDRFVLEDSRIRDRLFSRWALARPEQSGGYELLSHVRYTDSQEAEWVLAEEKPRNRKGLGALWTSRPLSDLDELDVSAVTVNISLTALTRLSPGEKRTAFEFAGRTWHADDGYVATLDRNLLEAARRGIIVSAILLVPQARTAPDQEYGRLIAHPDAHPSGIYVMPNMTDREGVEAYGAGLDFLARRYSQPDKAFGRIHHWIMHNEVDMGWIWTNAGEKSALRYLDLYHKSMRLGHLIARQYNEHAQVFISLTHHWADDTGPRFYNASQMLELLLEFSRAEGDFDWAIAHHPYPQDLRNPRVWEDDQARFSFDTPKITYKNLEVLDAWVRQPRTFFPGRGARTLHLTEQGLNSPDYSVESLRDQAAGMAYAWNKMKPLESIEMFHYHNWVDNRHEGGLRIGLRKFPDDPDEPLGKKPVWHVYQALGTEEEEQATAFAKEQIGVEDWSEIRFRGEVE